MNTLLYHAFAESIGRENVIYAAITEDFIIVLHVDSRGGCSTLITDKIHGTYIRTKDALMSIYTYNTKGKELVPFNMNQWEALS